MPCPVRHFPSNRAIFYPATLSFAAALAFDAEGYVYFTGRRFIDETFWDLQVAKLAP